LFLQKFGFELTNFKSFKFIDYLVGRRYDEH
jgi:hypothetical protein